MLRLLLTRCVVLMTKDLPLLEAIQPESSEVPSSERIELFVRLIGLHQHQIHRYLLSLVPHAHDADDLLQNTNLFLWREFGKFTEGTSFVSWGCSVAYHEVLAWRKRRSRDRLVFSEEFLQAVNEQLTLGGDHIEARSRALAYCVESLPIQHREILQLRYGKSGSIDAIASQIGRSQEAVYRVLSRIRHALFDCITRRLEAELSQ